MTADTATNTHHDHFADRWGGFGDGLEERVSPWHE
jgi:hypothetical protein